jgi:uncharacterized protein (DUF1015 family)
MPDIRPFRAWRYDPGRAGELAALIAPPYDVISTAMQRALYERSPYNVVRLELTASEPGDAEGREGEAQRHVRARTELERWKETGILRRDTEPALYLYRQTFDFRGVHHERTSVVAAVRLSSWSNGSVLPHERTLAAPRAERLSLLRAVNANLSPIWALYEDSGQHVARAIATGLQNEPTEAMATVDDFGVEHAISALTIRASVDTIRRALAEHPLFIADGHHRYETAVAYRDEALIHPGPRDVGPRDFVMIALTAAEDPGLIVLPTHRLVHGISADRMARLPLALERVFAITEHEAPADAEAAAVLVDRLLKVDGSGRHVFVLGGLRAGKLLRLEPMEEMDAAAPPELAALDAWLVEKLLLEQCLGLTPAQLERQSHLSYTRDTGEAVRALAEGKEQLGIFLAPTTVSQLLDVARAGSVMPQKSTYFFPKPVAGLIIRSLDG